MQTAFDAFSYVDYVTRRWSTVAVSCGVAVAIAVAVSLILPNRYTATASILIDSPVGSDVRTATAVSPVYLESLRTYEHFASSDSLFQRAVEQLHLRGLQGGSSLESWRKRVLKVSKIRDTRILEISATLPEPKAAQGLGQFIAEETVKMSQRLLRESEADLLDEARQQEESSRARLEKAQSLWRTVSGTAPVDSLKNEIDSLAKAGGRLRRTSASANADVAEWSDRVRALSAAGSGAAHDSPERAREELDAARSRAAALEKERRALEEDVKNRGLLLARRLAERSTIEAELREATTVHDAASIRLRELQGTIGYRGERLKIVDPGVVPQKPSFPNLPLNALAALAAGLLVSGVYLSITFTRQRRVDGTWRDDTIPADR